MPTPEMLKKLLDEFAEKEAHTTAEISTITEQIAELEHRIIQSKQRLESVGVDRDKVKAMMNRYMTGQWLPADRAASSPGNGGKEPEKTAEPAVPLPAQAKLTMPTPRTSSTRLKAMEEPVVPASPAPPPAPPEPPPPAAPPPEPKRQEAAKTAASSPFVSSSRLRTMQAASPPPPPQSVSQAVEDALNETPPPPEAEKETPPGTTVQIGAEPPQPQESPSSGRARESRASAKEKAAQAQPPAAPPAPTPAPPQAPSPAAALKSAFFSESDSEFDEFEALTAPAAPNAAPAASAPPAPAPAPAPQAAAPPQPTPPASQPAKPGMLGGGFGDDDEFEKQMEGLGGQSPAPVAQEAGSSPDTEAESIMSELEEDSDDTVKSINDALRGLFR